MSSDLSTAEVTWSRVEADFYVGSRAGVFLGYVDDVPASHALAWDMYSRPLGEFSSLGEAMQAVNALSAVNEGASDVA